MGARRGRGSATEEEATYALGAVVRLTGISAHVLRAWERRYGAVEPRRTPGGSRRYTEADVARLRRLRAAVDGGHPISELASLSDAELERRAAELSEAPPPQRTLRPLIEAVDALDEREANRLLSLQLSALGPAAFARDVATPLLREVGDRWEQGSLCVASEHLASALLRGLLSSALRHAPSASDAGPRILFTALPGERHELGVLNAAIVAQMAGAQVTYLGPDLPTAEIVRAAFETGAAAVAIGVTALGRAAAQRELRALRQKLPPAVSVWVGGAGVPPSSLPDGVREVQDLEELERLVALLAARTS